MDPTFLSGGIHYGTGMSRLPILFSCSFVYFVVQKFLPPSSTWIVQQRLASDAALAAIGRRNKINDPPASLFFSRYRDVAQRPDVTRFIEVMVGGRMVAVNVAEVVRVECADGGTEIFLKGRPEPLMADDPYDAVMQKIRRTNGR